MGWENQWTTAEDAIIKELYPTLGSRGVAKKLSNRKYKSIMQRAFKLGIGLEHKNSTHKKLNIEQEKEILNLYNTTNLSVSKIKQKLNINTGLDAIYDVLRENNIKVGKTGNRCRLRTDEEEEKIASDYLNGKDIIDLAFQEQTSVSAILLILRRRKVETRNPAYGGPKLRPTYTDSRGRSFKFRSFWELAMAKWLDKNNIQWDYEKETYYIPLGNEIKRYTPDFWLYNYNGKNVIIDIKGKINEKQFLKINYLKENRKDLNLQIWHYKDMRELNILPGKSKLKEK